MNAHNSIPPPFGIGTFRLQGQTVIDSVSNALALGYRVIDTAQIYENEAEIGQAIAEAENPPSRDALFITTKIWTENLAADALIPSLEHSLAKLRTDHVDLTLIHWPSPNAAVPLADSIHALKEAQARGLTRAIGVSNFPSALLKEAIEIAGPGVIRTNQIELHPFLQNRKLADFTQAQGISVTSYMTLARGQVMDDAVLQDIGRAHGVSPAQIALAWAMQLGYAVIPSSTKRGNLEANLAALKLELSDDEMARIAALDRGQRLTDPEGLAPAWD
ncbi:MAG: 2,5-didehydrogluconate reductase DkgB [Pseudomonadota bacterium]|nr:2,5-didehydrogluconate reductase DkgB [Pseudomonadota bacterium]